MTSRKAPSEPNGCVTWRRSGCLVFVWSDSWSFVCQGEQPRNNNQCEERHV